MLKLVDLCAGTGAFSIGLKDYCKVVYANDIEKSSKLIYDLNFNHKLTLGDINTIDPNTIPEHDVITSGFPCQPYSISGKRLGFKDERSGVLFAILKIVKIKKPKIVLLENVKNILTHDNGNTIKFIEEQFTSIGYNFQLVLVDTAKHTKIPQHRERVYMIITQKKLPGILTKIKEVKCDKISTYLEINVDDKYYYTEKSSIYEKLLRDVTKVDTIYQYRRTFVRENKSNLCPTLTANMGTGGHNVPIILDKKGIRKLSPRECFNLQGFAKDYKLPDNLSDSHIYKLVGNAVSVPVVELLGKIIFSELMSSSLI